MIMKKSLLFLILLSVVFAYVNHLIHKAHQLSIDVSSNNNVILNTKVDQNPVVTSANYTRIYRDDISERVSYTGYIRCESDTYTTTDATTINYSIGDIVLIGNILFRDGDTGRNIPSTTYGRISDISVYGNEKTVTVEDWDTIVVEVSIPTIDSSYLTNDTVIYYRDGSSENELSIQSSVLDKNRNIIILVLESIDISKHNVNGATLEIFINRVYEYDVKIIQTKSLGKQISFDTYMVFVVTQTNDGLEFEEVEVQIGKIINQKAILISDLPVNTKVLIINSS